MRYRAMKRIAVPLVLVALAVSAAQAVAQPVATPVPSATVPATGIVPGGIPSGVLNNPYVQSVLQAIGGVGQTTNGPTAIGSVTYFKHFNLQLQTAPNVYRQIYLHQGTIINPRGATIQNGQRLDVSGQPQADGSLAANEITIR